MKDTYFIDTLGTDKLHLLPLGRGDLGNCSLRIQQNKSIILHAGTCIRIRVIQLRRIPFLLSLAEHHHI